jgi:hypothetical protein
MMRMTTPAMRVSTGVSPAERGRRRKGGGTVGARENLRKVNRPHPSTMSDKFQPTPRRSASGLANPTAPPSAAPVLAAAPVMTGELGAVAFFDLLRVCETARFTAVLSIAAQTVAGRVRFTDGAIVGAQAEEPDARSSPTNGRDARKLLTRRLDGARATFSVRLAESELPRVTSSPHPTPLS